jgi:hypothetical protein
MTNGGNGGGGGGGGIFGNIGEQQDRGALNEELLLKHKAKLDVKLDECEAILTTIRSGEYLRLFFF